MRLNINGQGYEVLDAPDRPLLWVLRDELGFTGTKFGCGVGICGSCSIHLDGSLARACITPVSAAQGREIKTIEGLGEVASDGEYALHPIQQAFQDEQVPQCGWCMPGQMMTAAALLENNPDPSPEEIRQTMSGVYCRCGTYYRIRKAVSRAVQLAADTNQEGP